MADQLKGIPFSSDDEGKSFPDRAKDALVAVTELDEAPLHLDEIYIVTFSYVLGNWKALLSTSRPDGRYYEVTHSRDRDTTFVDTYIKISNTAIEHVNT